MRLQLNYLAVAADARWTGLGNKRPSTTDLFKAGCLDYTNVKLPVTQHVQLASKPLGPADGSPVTIGYMSKKFKGKTCVYCAEPESTTTSDHVVARCFFTVPERDNLPQVPACEPCNCAKSDLELYLAAILPQGARHQEDVSEYWAASRARLDKNLKIKRQIANGFARFQRINEEGARVDESVIPIESELLLQLSGMIAKGLLFYHWGVIVPAETCVLSTFMNATAEQQFLDIRKYVQPKQFRAEDGSTSMLETFKQTGEMKLGTGTFTYEGFYAPIDSPHSIWRMNFYGVKLGHLNQNETTTNLFVIIPGPSYVGVIPPNKPV